MPVAPLRAATHPTSEATCIVIQTAHLGDVVLTLPLIQRLAERHGPVDVLTTPAAAPLVAGQPGVARAIPFDKSGESRGVGGLLRIGRALAAQAYAAVYLPHQSLRSAVLAWLTRSPWRIGYAGSPGAFLYTGRIPKPATGHVSERLLALAGGGSRPPGPWISLTERDRQGTGSWLAERGIGVGYVVLAPGARWGTKRWPYFDRLAAELKEQLVVIGGAEDRERGAAIVSAATGRAWSAAGVLSLRESAALIEQAVCVVSNDSLALHLASGLARPVVAVFGPTAPRFGFGPVGAEDVVVEREGLSCRPCSVHGPRTCPLGHHHCMTELSVATVVEAVRERLRRARAEVRSG